MAFVAALAPGRQVCAALPAQTLPSLWRAQAAASSSTGRKRDADAAADEQKPTARRRDDAEAAKGNGGRAAASEQRPSSRAPPSSAPAAASPPSDEPAAPASTSKTSPARPRGTARVGTAALGAPATRLATARRSACADRRATPLLCHRCRRRRHDDGCSRCTTSCARICNCPFPTHHGRAGGRRATCGQAHRGHGQGEQGGHDLGRRNGCACSAFWWRRGRGRGRGRGPERWFQRRTCSGARRGGSPPQAVLRQGRCRWRPAQEAATERRRVACRRSARCCANGIRLGSRAGQAKGAWACRRRRGGKPRRRAGPWRAGRSSKGAHRLALQAREQGLTELRVSCAHPHGVTSAAPEKYALHKRCRDAC